MTTQKRALVAIHAEGVADFRRQLDAAIAAAQRLADGAEGMIAHDQVYRLWEELTDRHKQDPGRTVQGWVPLLGWFDLRNGQIHRVIPSTRRQCGTFRPATRDELDQIDWAIAHGAFQIELQPRSGILGGQAGLGNATEQEYTPLVLYRATGIPFLNGVPVFPAEGAASEAALVNALADVVERVCVKPVVQSQQAKGA